MRVISQADLASALERWSRGVPVIAPRSADGVVLYRPLRSRSEITWDFGRPVVSVKEFFFPPTERLFTMSRSGGHIQLTETLPQGNVILFGVRPCDARGLRSLDALFGSDPPDPHYCSRREHTILMGLTCNAMGPSCFCRSVGGAPDDTTGVDIALTEVESGYAIRATTEKGDALLRELAIVEVNGAPPRPALNEPIPIPDELAWLPQFGDEYWARVSERCLSCRACAYVCPTCRCFDVRDERFASDPEGEAFERIRCWESCAGENYRRIAGGHNPRSETGQRLRNRFFCKFDYSPVRYGVAACTGCGRCIDVCPVGVDITEVLAHLATG